MESGEYVPDEGDQLMMVASRLAEPDAANGFILDGYPRTWRRWTSSTACSLG